MTDATPPPPERTLDTESLKGLAHPLRVAIFDALSSFGAATASGLAERLHESSGATSYHLRQLERHGFVREVEGRGSGRERWWERVPGSLTVSGTDFEKGSAAREASRLVSNEFERSREQHLRAFREQAYELPEEWIEPTRLATSNLRLTAAEMAELNDRLGAVMDEIAETYRGRRSEGSRPVQLHINLFPLVDGVPQGEPAATPASGDTETNERRRP